MVGTEMVTLVSAADILRLRTSIKYVGRSFIQMKRKGVDYCPVIMRYATVKRELAHDRRMVTYILFGQEFLGQMVYRPGPQAKIAHTPMCTPLKRLCLSKISEIE